MTAKKLFLLDAMALIYRAYFAMSKNPRINSKGLNTSAILGFTNTLWEIIKKEKPTHIGVAFDTMAPTVRHEGFIEYKANREKMPEDLATSIPWVKKVIEAFDIPLLYVDGYEADDVIGTLSKKAEDSGFDVFMMTPDKDYGQLVTSKVKMYKPARMGNGAEVLGVEEICAKYDLKEPKQLIDILGLMGDAADNIPGVPGVGEKTAIKLLKEFDSVENLLENTDKLKGKLKEKVEENAKQALMSKELATIIMDVPIGFDEEALEIKSFQQAKIRELFDELEFRNLAKRIFAELSTQHSKQVVQGDLFSLFDQEEPSEEEVSINTINNTEHKYYLVDNEVDYKKLVEDLGKQKSFCFDTETTGLDTLQAKLLGISFAWEKGKAYYLKVPAQEEEIADFLIPLHSIFANGGIEKIAQNLKYDLSIMNRYNVKIANPCFDTMLAHYIVQPESRHNMDVMAENYLSYKPVAYEEIVGKGRKQLSLEQIDIQKVKDYAAEDADITFQLKQKIKEELDASGQKNIFYDIEMPLVEVLASMEKEGIRIDIDALKEISEDLDTQLKRIEKTIYDEAGITFNIASPKQLGEVLFNQMKIVEKPKKTKSGQFSTSEDVLNKLAAKHPIVESILEYRSLSKLKSTYVDALPNLVSPVDHRIHTSYNQAVVATGRLSSTNPNLQNIPIRTARGKEIRKAFVPRNEDFILLAADYSQIELRIFASLCQDPALVEAFKEGVDVHTATASKVYKVPVEEVDADLRRKAKTVNFGIVYGISAFGLAERLGISRREGSDIIKAYFEEYPQIKAYMDKVVEQAREQAYVSTILGRKRYLRDIQSANSVVRGFAERNAINAPIQGSSADMIKLAMINIYREMKDKDLKSRMILQVHDELVFDAHKEEIDVLKKIIRKHMLESMPLDGVPLEIDMKTGRNWLEAH
ncbi:MAG: DNA polymerase I [Bacteroidales bacterium]